MKSVLFLMNIKEPSGEYSPAIFNWYGVLERLGYKVYYEDYTKYNPDEFYQLVKENKPDYIFHPTYTSLHSEFIRLQEFSKVYCIHSDDDWRFNDYIKYWIPFTNGAIGYQNNKQTYLKEGVDDNYYIRARWAFNPNTMYFDFKDDKQYCITHVGGLHGGKAEAVASLKTKGLDIELVNPNFNSYEHYLNTFHKSTISLCFTNNSLGTAKQSKTRVGEMPYYCILASEAWPNMEMWNMEPNKDFILLDGDNSIELINKVLNDKTFANEMYQSVKEILLNSNTVFHEWNTIMSSIDEDYKPANISDIIKTYNLI
jgi:hypothetical protein